ncbi:3-phosphoshikimate 1-carboxyvinyltransferase [Streptomyces rectiviolaceus]|uniref:3-phosphoshikimate 1-carboxyvinyltransferase n=1 Tax=Streptomyces rectiviolaceus TaxID=332591 RepID=A0ABP6MGK6_9ACTN
MTTARIEPALDGVRGATRIPHSKPHMQRALLLSLLANAPSTIMNPAWSSEAESLFSSVREFGLDVTGQDDRSLHLSGVGKSVKTGSAKVSVVGSAFNFRAMAAVACLSRGETVLEGNAAMLKRPVTEYLSFIPELGGTLTDISDAGHLRTRIRGSSRLGGTATVDTQHSSQVLTSVLLIAPLADRPVRIRCTNAGAVGEGYIGLTESMMRRQGAGIERDGSSFVVHPSVYDAGMHELASDFTALSYLAGAVATAPRGSVTVDGYYPSELSSEREFLAVLERLGIRTAYDPVERRLRIEKGDPAAEHVEIDGRNIPTVVPTLAAIAPFVAARVTLRNAAHVNNHKCRRVDVMIRELTRMGCWIEPKHGADGRVDGFTTVGRQAPAGGVALESHGDHRIFLSLATAALGADRPSVLGGAEHLHASFPDFLTSLNTLGAGVGPAA